MGLKSFFRNWSKREDADRLEKAAEETQMDEIERTYDTEDYEAKKDDAYFNSRFPANERDSL